MAVSIEVHGAREVRRALKDMQTSEGKRGTTALTKAHKKVAEVAADRARRNALTGTPLQRKQAPAIKAAATATRASISVRATKKHPAANVAYWGTIGNKRLGWFADPKFAAYTGRDQNLPPWVGNTWTPGARGEGPHVINDAVADTEAEMVAVFEHEFENAARDVGLL